MERERKEGRQVGERQDMILSVRRPGEMIERRGKAGRGGQRTMSATHTGLSSVV